MATIITILTMGILEIIDIICKALLIRLMEAGIGIAQGLLVGEEEAAAVVETRTIITMDQDQIPIII